MQFDNIIAKYINNDQQFNRHDFLIKFSLMIIS